MRITSVLIAGTTLLVALSAQTLPSFEVASIRPQAPGGRMEINGFYTYPGGRIVGHGCTLEYLLEEAFNVQEFQISGGPAWMKDARYELEARPPASSQSSHAAPLVPKAPPSDEQRLMLQSLLIERFHLKAHPQTTQGVVYFLVRGNKPLKLDTAKDAGKSDFSWVGSPHGGALAGDGIAGENISIPILASRLSRYLARPVIDKTGITGFFDFKYQYVPDDPHPDLVSSILTSVQEIGLKLESTKGELETIVIEQAEKPSDN